ncbi:MAG: glucose-1-phosphate adenylyltransferase [Gammaproteobacteria bacterium]
MHKYYVEPKIVTELTRKTLVLVLAGGEGSRLKDLTRWRAKPAVPFGGKYRIIDFALSNCVNSGLRRIGVLTQYKSHSLIRHLQRAWSFMRPEIGEFVEILPAQQRTEKKQWYQGTADALFQNLDIMKIHSPDYVMVLGGDHIYTMDYSEMIVNHAQSGADFTVGCETVPGNPEMALASMGIYVFSTRFLYNTLVEDAELERSSHDFGRDIIPSKIADSVAIAYPFRKENGEHAYWRDVGTVESYWQANMELCEVEPELNLYARDWPIWTYQTQHPPAKFIFDDEGRRGEAIDSLISAGCILSGARVKRSILFFLARVEEGSLIKDSVILPKVQVGKNCVIKRAIIDKSCVIPDGTVIGENLEEDAKRFHVTPSGIVLVTPNMLGQDLYSLEGEDLKWMPES